MIERILDGSLMPHGQCLLWRADLLFLHLVGDFLTVLAYALIPGALVYFIYKRADIKFNWVSVLFAGFIAFCGLTHAIGLVNIWHGYYFIEGMVKLATGIISIVTAYMLWRLMPSFLSVPSIAMLKQRNQELESVKAELERVNKTLEARVKQRTYELEKQANTDSVTGLSNRFSIIEKLQSNFLHFQRYKRTFTVLMIDIDHFKQINDLHGHQVGDQVLEEVAKSIKKTCRQTDFVGRYGGEEFLAILPETCSEPAVKLAERIRANIEALPLSIESPVTCSIGVSHIEAGLSQKTLVKQADEAMYSAKNSGRNKVMTYKAKI